MLLNRITPPSSATFLQADLDEAAKALSAITRTVGNLDPETREHCQRLAIRSKSFGEYLNLSELDIHTLMWGGYLHDVGKVGVPMDVLFKRGQLSPEEWEVMKQHVLIGEQICHSLFPMERVTPLIRYHHEHWDGSGYPDGLAGEQIPFLARVIQILDIYDALTHDRCYKPTYTHSRALEIIAEETAKGWYQPELVQEFFIFTAIEKGDDGLETLFQDEQLVGRIAGDRW
jgi:putative two-component system response regulator